MSKKVVTNRNEYPVIFCAEINHGVLMEIVESRPLYTIAEEFDKVDLLQYKNDDVDSGKTYETPLELQMIQKIDPTTIQIRLVKSTEVN